MCGGGGAQAAKSGGAQEEAWAAAPDRGLRLRMKDIRPALRERWLQLFWPDDGRWWPGQVLDVRPRERRISLLYKTGAGLKGGVYRNHSRSW